MKIDDNDIYIYLLTMILSLFPILSNMIQTVYIYQMLDDLDANDVGVLDTFFFLHVKNGEFP